MKYYIISLLFKIYNFLVSRKWFDGVLYKSLIKCTSKNCIRTKEMFNTKVNVDGYDNHVYIDGRVEGCLVYVEGDNNTLTIGKGTLLHDCSIFIRGNNSDIIIGDNVTIHSKGKIVCQGHGVNIVIGNECLFSECVDIWNSDTHEIRNSNGEIINRPRSINIGDHVWLGKGVSVLKGANIEPNTVIGMKSIVTSKITANTIAVGNPAKIIKNNIYWNRNFVY